MATKIYIDQGHNPQNPNAGAEGNGYREQDITYRIGVELADLLEGAGFEVRLSRNDPEQVIGTSNQSSLTARVNDANSWGADYFISLHTNASALPSATGSEALVYRLGSRAQPLAESILEQLNISTGLRNRGVIARPGLYVLRRTAMPAVLVEMGFISNRRDADLMANSPELFAEGIANGIIDYLGLPASSSFPVQNIITPEPPERPYPQAPLPTPELDGSESATDDENAAENSFEYADFIRENPSTGYLKIQAYRGNQVYPVPNVEVIISRNFDGGERVFFAGATDENGIIDQIPLPAPPRGNSLSPDKPDKYSEYTLRARHEGYKNINTTVTIYGETKAVQPLQMILE